MSKRNLRRNFKSQQLKLVQRGSRSGLCFGGSLMTKAKNRTARPISSRDPMHLVLRSSKAKGIFSFGHRFNLKRVNEIVRRHCEKYGVKLIEYSNNYNHLHLLAKFPSRAVYLRFIRSLTGHLVLAVTGANRLRSLKDYFGEKGFWDYRPFSRVVRSWRGYRIARDYVVLNQLEAAGILPKRSGRLRALQKGERHWFQPSRRSQT